MSKRLAKFLPVWLAVVVVAFATVTATAWAAAQMAPTAKPAKTIAADAPFLVHGDKTYLRSYKGQPIMLWQVATWCPSCRAGLQTLAQHKSLIDASHLKIIVLRDYQNGGYSGPDMATFVAQSAPTLLHDPHFVYGEDTEALFKLYNPHHYVDVYHLIGPDGDIALISSAPSATFDKIERFIKAGAK